MLIPGETVPELEVDIIGGDSWRLANSAAENFAMLVFYRGQHCPLCKEQLEKISDESDKFQDLGIKILALSMDDEERAQETVEEWDIDELTLGYGLTRKKAEEWGLYISKGVLDGEPEIFSEPGMFFVRPNSELYAAYVQSVPFGRIDTDALLDGLEFVLEKNYPTRGTETGQ